MSDSINDDLYPSPIVPWHWAWAAVLATVTMVTLAFRYALPVRDGDLWFHMLYGKYFLDNKTLIADHTIFSWSPTTNDTIYCTWLPDIFYYLLYKVAGLPGTFAFRYLCLFTLVLTAFLFARRLKISLHPLMWFMVLLAVIMSYTAAFDKPEILSFVCMTLLAWNWWQIRSSGETSWKNCYLFPCIMLVWVNSHGGFVFGAVFLVLIGLGELLNTWLSPKNILTPRIRGHLAIALLLAAITPLLTPYGYRYPLQMFFDLLPTPENVSYNNKIAAYGSPFLFDDVYGIIMCADVAVVLLLLLYWVNFRKIEWSSLLANLVFAYLYTRFFRTTFYWVPVFLFSGLSLLAATTEALKGYKHERLVVRLLPSLTLMAALWLASLSLYNSFARPEKWLWIGFGITDNNPVAEAEYIERHFPSVRIGNTYDQGAYLLWKLWPSNRVFFDARHFPYRNWSDEFFSFANGKNVREMLDKYPCDLWCVGLGYLPLSMAILNSGEWRLAFYGKSAAVLVRKNIPLPNVSKVSHDIYDPKNLDSSIDCLKFACYVKDWPTAEKVLTAMNERFTYRAQQKAMLWANRLYHGLSAFYGGDYRVAVENLAPMRSAPTIIRYILTSSYHYLSGEAWQLGDVAAAREYAEKAMELVPEGNPYSLYNLGVILWEQGRTGGNGEDRPDWRQHLLDFLQTAPYDPEFDAVRPVAEAILEGRNEGLPSLLLPPEPDTARVSQDVWSEEAPAGVSWQN